MAPYPPYAGYGPPPGYVFAPPPPPVAASGEPLAEAWERFVAYFIDRLILSVINLAPMAAVLAVLWPQIAGAFDTLNAADQSAIRRDQVVDPFPALKHMFEIELSVLALFIPIVFMISYLYMVVFMHRTGQTIGKRVMKIKVVSAADGSRITKAMARRRWIVEMPGGVIGLYFSYADSLWLLWDKPYRQCLHDKCADTAVVKLKT